MEIAALFLIADGLLLIIALIVASQLPPEKRPAWLQREIKFAKFVWRALSGNTKLVQSYAHA